jgi:GT2 family glycosyltransferase
VTPEVSVVLVDYNAGDELRHALASIAAELGGREWDGAVVDNASRDGSADAVTALAPRMRLLRNADNVGFGRAVNQAVIACRGALVLVVNPDCRVGAGAFAALRAELEAHPDCAVVGPRILDPDGGVQGSARGDPDMLTGLFGRTSALRARLPLLPAARRNVVVDEAIAGGRPSVPVDWVSGACMLVRRDAFDAVGGFDERYFLYWEDADLCRRLRARGHHVRYVPGATAVHRVGVSSRTARAASIRAFHASAYLYYATHVAPGALDPRRPLARAILGARCALRLRSAAADGAPSPR